MSIEKENGQKLRGTLIKQIRANPSELAEGNLEVAPASATDPWEGSEGTALAMCRPQLDGIAAELSNDSLTVKTRFEGPAWAEFHTTDGRVLLEVRAHTHRYAMSGSGELSKLEIFTDETDPDFRVRIATLFRVAFPNIKLELQTGM